MVVFSSSLKEGWFLNWYLLPAQAFFWQWKTSHWVFSMLCCLLKILILLFFFLFLIPSVKRMQGVVRPSPQSVKPPPRASVQMSHMLRTTLCTDGETASTQNEPSNESALTKQTFLCLVYVSQLLTIPALWAGFPFPLSSEMWEWSKLLQVRETEQVVHTILWHQALLLPLLGAKIHFWHGTWSVKQLSSRSLGETWQCWAACGAPLHCLKLRHPVCHEASLLVRAGVDPFFDNAQS